MNRPLFGLSVAVCSHLAGSERAVRMGDTVYVSPAVFDLMKHANEAELTLLLRRVELITIPEPPSLYDPLPMLTRPPAFAPESFADEIYTRMRGKR